MAEPKALDSARNHLHTRHRRRQPSPEPEKRPSDTQRAIMLCLLRLDALLLALYTAFLFFQVQATTSNELVYDDNAVYTDEEALLLLEMHLRSYDPNAWRETARKQAWDTVYGLLYTVMSGLLKLAFTFIVAIPAVWIANNKYWPKQWHGHFPPLPDRYGFVTQWFCLTWYHGGLRLYGLAKFLVIQLIIKLGWDLLYAAWWTCASIAAVIRPLQPAFDTARRSFNQRYVAVDHSLRMELIKEQVRYLRKGVLGWILEWLFISACMACVVLTWKGVKNYLRVSLEGCVIQPSPTSHSLPTKTSDSWSTDSWYPSTYSQGAFSTAQGIPADEPWSGWGAPTPVVTIPREDQLAFDRSYRSYQSKIMSDPDSFESVWAAALGREYVNKKLKSTSAHPEAPSTLSAGIPTASISPTGISLISTLSSSSISTSSAPTNNSSMHDSSTSGASTTSSTTTDSATTSSSTSSSTTSSLTTDASTTDSATTSSVMTNSAIRSPSTTNSAATSSSTTDSLTTSSSTSSAMTSTSSSVLLITEISKMVLFSPLSESPQIISSSTRRFKDVFTTLFGRFNSSPVSSSTPTMPATAAQTPASSTFQRSHRSSPAYDPRDPLVGVDIEDLTLAQIAELSGPMNLSPTGQHTRSRLGEHEHAYCDLCRQRHGFEVMTVQKDFLYDWQMVN